MRLGDGHGLRRVALATAALAVLGVARGALAEEPPRKLVFGSDHDFAPYEWLDHRGEPTGFNVDLIRAIGREAGYEVEVRLGPWVEIREALEVTGTVDVADMYYSDARAELVEFAEPFDLAADELFVRLNARNPCSLDDLSGRTVIAQHASYAEDYLRELAADIAIVTVESEPEALRRLSSGAGDCALVTANIGRDALHRYGLSNLRTVGAPVNPRPYAFVVAKGRTDLVQELNAGLARVRASGEYRRLRDRWFRSASDGMSAAQVLRRVAFVLTALIVIALAALAWSWSLRKRVRIQTAALHTELAERRRAETAAATREEQFRTLVEHAPEAIAVIHAETGKFRLVNDNAVLLLGREREALSQLGPVDVSAPRQSADGAADIVWRRELEAALDRQSLPFEWTFLDGRGEEVPCEVRLVRLPDPDAPLVRASIVDISDRREIDERRRLAQRMESVGRLAGGVAHDFNNLLTVINAHTHFLRRGVTAQRDRDSLDEIGAALERAAGLTRQLLAFSRKQVVTPRHLALNHIVEDIHKLLTRLLGAPIEIELDLDPALHPVLGDVGQLEQVLLNLAINARDAMPTGGHLRIATRNEKLSHTELAGTGLSAGDYVSLTMTDTGIGMDATTRSRIFEPFFTTKAAGKGTGLGLATVYGVVRSYHGVVQVDSEPGAGATFRVLLPRSFGEVDEIVPRGAEPDAVGQETVLVVEDEAPVRRAIRRTLEGSGYQVLTASGAEEALAHFRDAAGRIDLLVTDFIMPGKSGRSIADALRSERPDLPVLIVSGFAEGAFSEDEELPARTVVMAKPFRPAQLVHRVRELLDAAR